MRPRAQRLSKGIRYHQAGRLAQAERVYRDVLAREPGNAEALHLLGILGSECGNHETGAALISKAIEIEGPVAAWCANLGTVLDRMGKPDAAAACYRQALEGRPEDAQTRMKLANVYLERGRREEAIVELAAAALFEPRLAEAHFRLGNVLHQSGRLEDAERAYARATGALPAFPEAHFNRGVVCLMLNRPAEAVAAYREAVRHNPHYPEAHNNLGLTLYALGRIEASLAHYESAIAARPDYTDALCNLGVALNDLGRHQEAIGRYRQALAIEPNHPEAWTSLASALISTNCPAKAVEACRKVLETAPHDADARWNMGVAQLMLGNLAEGWEGYEWRFRRANQHARDFARELWDGSRLDGRRILLHAEQGLGDSIQFIRYAPEARRRGGTVLVECHAPLVRLFRSVAGPSGLAPRGAPLAEFDCHAPLLSLPRILGTTVENIPRDVPYLHAEPELVRKWALIIRDAAGGAAFKIGLVWAGNPGHRNDRNRSVPPDKLALLAGVPNSVFFSLQQGDAADARPRDGSLRLVPLPEPLTDFAETAAVISNLDLVISADTSVAHLAGALGHPVWTLLPFAADWRWMIDREDSPWYPTMRLFRQSAPQDWDSVLARVRAELLRRAPPG